MALRVLVTPRAGRDLREIRAFMLERNPAAADRIRNRIFNVLRRLADFPLTGATTGKNNVRVAQLKEYPYRIFYIVGSDAIEVVHIRHTSRQPLNPSDI